MELFIELDNNNYGITKLIETPNTLFNVCFLTKRRGYSKYHDDSFYEILENSLIKHANTVQHLKISKRPITAFLSFFVNLKSLELVNNDYYINMT